MTRIETWMVDHNITSVRSEGAPDRAESPYKVVVDRHVPWLKKGETTKVPVNDPSSKGWTFTLSKPAKTPPKDPDKLDPEVERTTPSKTKITLQYFSPPGSEKVPLFEDLVKELKTKFMEMKKRHAKGDVTATMPQPYLGTMLVLNAWLSEKLFLELMDL